MRAKIKQRLYCDWPGNIRRRLMALTLREWSGMRTAIQSYKRTHTFVMFEDNDPVAWSLAEWDRYDKTYNIMIYVRRDKRRLGYGRQLFTTAKKWVKEENQKYCVFPDSYNSHFFLKMGEKV